MYELLCTYTSNQIFDKKKTPNIFKWVPNKSVHI